MFTIRKYSYISPRHVEPLPLKAKAACKESGIELTGLYRCLSLDYPKFFKMDRLSKLGFLAAELLNVNDEQNADGLPEDCAVVCFNGSASLETDKAYSKTIEPENFFPSPSLFVYTLPSIVTGEIAIRHKLRGETSFYVSSRWNANIVADTVRQIFAEGAMEPHSVIAAWLECEEDIFEAFMMLVDKSGKGLPFTAETADALISDLRIYNNF